MLRCHSQGTESPPSLSSSFGHLFCQGAASSPQSRDVLKYPRHSSQPILRALVGPRSGPGFREPPTRQLCPSIASPKPENRCGQSRARLAALTVSGAIPSKDSNFTLLTGNRGPEKNGGLLRPPLSWRQPVASCFPALPCPTWTRSTLRCWKPR